MNNPFENLSGIKPDKSIDELKVEWYNNLVGELDKVDGYNCPVCKNRGYIAMLDDIGRECHKPCKCHKTRQTLLRAKKSGLGDIITDYTFDKYVATEEWQTHLKTSAQEFCYDDNAKWFYIGGQVGCGKTHLCTAISAHYIKQGKDVKYMLWAEDAKKLKSLVSDAFEYEEEIKLYKNIEVLYIDDFLKTKQGEQPTVADINLAFELINRRLINRDLITVVSSEKTIEDVIGYDEATASRMAEKAGKYKLSIDRDISKNYRLRG